VIRWILLCFAAAGALAQEVEIYSEFQRPDPYGDIVQVDRSPRPREILSPGVARNAWASFHVAVRTPANTPYLLYVATNPINACRVALYKEHFAATRAGWIPDKLTEVTRLPDYGFMPDPDDGVPGQTTRVYLLDLWIPPDSAVGRFRVEVQLKLANWVVRPMEVRILQARIPVVDLHAEGAVLPPIDSPADYSAAPGPPRDCGPVDSVRAAICRNADQDMALAEQMGAAEAVRGWWREMNLPRVLGAEEWLRVRDLLLAGKSGADGAEKMRGEVRR
jgi:hypothetical protein